MPSRDDTELQNLKATKERLEVELKKQTKAKQRLEDLLVISKRQGISSPGSQKIERTIRQYENEIASNQQKLNSIISLIRRHEIRAS